MPVQSAATTVTEDEFASFERGVDRESPRTKITKGGYEAGENVLLGSDTSGRVLTTVYQDVALDSSVTWPAGNPVWCAPYTYSSYNATTRVLTYTTHLLIARSTGQVHTYTPGSPGTVANVRRGMSGAAQFNHFAYDMWLGLVNGRDAPMKYGQHFLWNGQLESTPFLFPFGSRPISPLVPSIAQETWTQGSGNDFRLDAQVSQGSRVGTHSLLVRANTNSYVVFPAAVDYTKAPQPYGGDTLADTDFVLCSFVSLQDQTSTGNVRLVFGSGADPTVNYYTFTLTPNASNTAWVTKSALRSAAVATGAPNWNDIRRVTLYNDDPSVDLYFDDLYWLYVNAPPAFGVATAHKDRVIGGGSPVGATAGEPFLSTLVYSDAEHPDNYPSANTQIISGGFESLAQANTINALREYGDQIVIGCPAAIFAWTIGESGNPVKSTLSTEYGIDSHRALVETPQGSLIFVWQRGVYIMRATGRQYVSAKIRPLLVDLNLTDPSWSMAVTDEETKTIRISFREGTASAASKGVIFDYVRAQELGEPVWTGTFTQMFDYAVQAYINGSRETLYTKVNDPQIYRLHQTRNGVGGSVTLPWLSRSHRDELVKWLGLALPYVADTALNVSVRYAATPDHFDTATFTQTQTFPATTSVSTQSRVVFAGTAKWAQVQFSSTGYFELYPPVVLYGVSTDRKG